MRARDRLVVRTAGILCAGAALVAGCRPDAPPAREDAGIVTEPDWRGAASALEVCAKLDELRAKKTPTSTADAECVERISWTRELDGPTLWTLRSTCILDSSTLDDAYRCNRANHPAWPHASRGR